MACMWRAEDNFWKFAIFFYFVGAKVIMLGGKHLYLWLLLTSPGLYIFILVPLLLPPYLGP